ncbi:ribosome biogenesis GTPase Der [Candidatus Nitrosacidococcus tergens]|uniref:GTPase Der n=1 Tax=Candidatus Nitrosacidococcus tergens TaxID=553981 RepID=A0A7G1Q828_9GAMM|nr:ribosome biogenesis GTPase Der [Candidatus Nitrosacidococcus tergens]CAB1274927.1 GTPase involved in ribosome synthesis and maintenance [Candidatus Nitrosacidococcus tergens]
MTTTIALVGRPNVGKSTLFNYLTRSRDALVVDQPGVTRDRKYGIARYKTQSFLIIDTGGVTDQISGISELMNKQVKLAITEANIILFIVDGSEGLSSLDEMIADQLRYSQKLIKLVVNKVERKNQQPIVTDFYQLGLGDPVIISARQRLGIDVLIDSLPIDQEEEENESIPTKGIQFAILGRPNVGKSTLVNRLLGEERMITFDEPGTTRDSIAVSFIRNNQRYTLIDTAGIRRRSKIFDVLEKFSVVKAIETIKIAQVAILVIDACDSLVEQDLHLAGLILESGKAVIIAVNKWDKASDYQQQRLKANLNRRLPFLDFARVHFISALHGKGVDQLFPSIDESYQAASCHLSTGALNQALAAATAAHPLPLIRGRQIKLRYAHQGGENPPKIIIHGNQTESMPDHYKRYLIRYFRDQFSLVGTPIKLEFKTTQNPYKDRVNILTQHQLKKRKRIIKDRKSNY